MTLTRLIKRSYASLDGSKPFVWPEQPDDVATIKKILDTSVATDLRGSGPLEERVKHPEIATQLLNRYERAHPNYALPRGQGYAYYVTSQHQPRQVTVTLVRAILPSKKLN